MAFVVCEDGACDNYMSLMLSELMSTEDCDDEIQLFQGSFSK